MINTRNPGNDTPQVGLTAGRVLSSEWIKFRSMRSTWVAIAVMAGAILGLGLAYAAEERATGRSPSGGVPYASDSAAFGLIFGQLVMGIISVLVITGEYGSTEIRGTLVAVPRRWDVIAAKAAILAIVGFVVASVCSWGAIQLSWPTLASVPGIVDDRFTCDGIRVAFGTCLGVMLVSLMSLGIGSLTRSSALAVAIVVCLLFVFPLALSGFSTGWVHSVSSYLVSNADNGLAVVPRQLGPDSDFFSFGKSLLVTTAWAAAPLGAGTAVFCKRDA